MNARQTIVGLGLVGLLGTSCAKTEYQTYAGTARNVKYINETCFPEMDSRFYFSISQDTFTTAGYGAIRLQEMIHDGDFVTLRATKGKDSNHYLGAKSVDSLQVRRAREIDTDRQYY